MATANMRMSGTQTAAVQLAKHQPVDLKSLARRVRCSRLQIVQMLTCQRSLDGIPIVRPPVHLGLSAIMTEACMLLEPY